MRARRQHLAIIVHVRVLRFIVAYDTLSHGAREGQVCGNQLRPYERSPSAPLCVFGFVGVVLLLGFSSDVSVRGELCDQVSFVHLHPLYVRE